MVPVALLMSARDAADIIDREDLNALAAAQTLRVGHTLTRSHPPDWASYTRQIDTQMLTDSVDAPNPRASRTCAVQLGSPKPWRVSR